MPTYERPTALKNLLQDVCAHAGQHQISVIVYDDASSADYTWSHRIVHERGWEYVRAVENHGKRRFWKWMDQIYSEQRQRPESLFLMLQDDVRLCDRFFDRMVNTWMRITDPKVVTLTLMRDGRTQSGSWTHQPGLDAGPVFDIGWVDGIFLCNRRYFQTLGWKVNRVEVSRWRNNPKRSSGVGEQMSHRLFAEGMGMYGVKKSLLVHLEGRSNLNPSERRTNPLTSTHFIDGADAHRALIDEAPRYKSSVASDVVSPPKERDPVIVSMATVPRRLRSLRLVVRRLLPQCDRLNVYLNGHRDVPGFLKHPKIEIAKSSDHGNRGDAGKFWWSDKLGDSAYHLTVDDDILYPNDYCRTLVDKIDQLGRRSIVGVHGVMLPRIVRQEYYGDRRVYQCFNQLRRSRSVHLLGTGTIAYHTSTLTVRPGDFRRPNMADIWLAMLARQQRVPMICLRRSARWLADLGDPEPGKSIAATQGRHNAIQAAVLRTMNPWDPPLTVTGVLRGNMKKARKSAVPQLRRANPHANREFGARKADDTKPNRLGTLCNRGVRIKE